MSYPVTPFLAAAVDSSSISARDRRKKDVTVHEWNFSIEQEIAKETTVQVSYFGSEGSHLASSVTLNGIDPATGKRPYASLTSSTIGYSGANSVSNFNSLQLGLKRNLSTGLLIASSYQWSHSINDGSVGGGESDGLQNTNCRSCERASSDFDIRQSFTTSAIWNIPAGKGRRVLGNARHSGISCWEGGN